MSGVRTGAPYNTRPGVSHGGESGDPLDMQVRDILGTTLLYKLYM